MKTVSSDHKTAAKSHKNKQLLFKRVICPGLTRILYRYSLYIFLIFFIIIYIFKICMIILWINRIYIYIYIF